MGFAGMIYTLLLIAWAHLIPVNALKKNMHYPIGSFGHMHSRIAEAEQAQHLDILFLGSSHAYRGFDPRIFRENGFHTFNFGSSSQTPLQTLRLMEQYLDQLDPKLVIFEVYPSIFQNDGVESSLDIVANAPVTPELLQMAGSVNHIKTYHTLFYDLFREFFNLNDGFREPKVRGGDTYVSGGFVETAKTYNYSPVTEKIKRDWGDRDWQIREDQWQAFREILTLFRERKIDYWLVQTPVTRAAYDLYQNNDYVDSLFAAQGVYYNLNKVLTLDDHSDFMDYHHLNQSGVKRTNEALIRLIRERSAIPE